MRTPIAHALAWPQRIESGVESLDLFQVARLDFVAPDMVRFPCLKLAFEAVRAGGTAPVVLNAANEVAVAAFLDRRLGFLGIAELVDRTLQAIEVQPVEDLDQLLEMDRQARRLAEQALQTLV
jgi:1-deoxy-D-xylulose-5-phosphate reductoisomerase